MARMMADILSFADAEEFLAGSETRKLGHNTYVERWNGDAIAVRYHRTAIVVYRRDGAVRLTSGGWMTTTTKQRLNACSPYAVYSEGTDAWGDPVWAVSGPKGSARFSDDMWSDPDGSWDGHKDAALASFRRNVRMARERREMTRRGKYAMPWG